MYLMTHTIGVNVEKSSHKKCYTFIFLDRQKLIPYSVMTNPVNTLFCAETYFGATDILCSSFAGFIRY